MDLGEYQKAQAVFERCLSLYNERFPHNYTGIARTLTGLGNTYRKLGNYKKAKDILEQSRQHHEKHFSPDHYPTMWTLLFLGNTYSDLGDYENAKKLLNKCLKFYEKHYGKSYFETAKIIRDLGRIHFLEGNIAAAEELTHKAYKIFQQHNHPEVYTCLENLAEVCLKKSQGVEGRKELNQMESLKVQATDYLNQALAIVKAHFPEDSPHILRIEAKLNEPQNKHLTTHSLRNVLKGKIKTPI